MNIEYEQFKKKKMGQNSAQSKQPKATQNSNLVKKEPNLFLDSNLDLDLGIFNKRTEKVSNPRQPTNHLSVVKKEEDQADIPDMMRLDSFEFF